jgi:hypothetical protein
MSQCDAVIRAMQCIGDIRDEALCAVDTMEAGAVDKAALVARINASAAKLKLVAEALPAGRKKQNTLAKKVLLHSLDARVCAVLRAMSAGGKNITPSNVMARAMNLSVWKPLPEPVRVVWRKKDKGGYRPIVISGLMEESTVSHGPRHAVDDGHRQFNRLHQERRWRRKAPHSECLQRHRKRNQLVVDPRHQELFRVHPTRPLRVVAD